MTRLPDIDPSPGGRPPGEGVFGKLPELEAAEADRIPPPFPRIDRLAGRLADLCLIAAGIQLVVLIALMGWLVFGRYVLNDTPTWIEQASLLMIAWITFLGAAIGVREERHLSIDFVREGMAPVPRAILRVLADVMVIIFAGVMAWQGWKLVMTNLEREIPMLGMSESWRAAALVAFGVIGAFFALLRLAQRSAAPRRSLPWD